MGQVFSNANKSSNQKSADQTQYPTFECAKLPLDVIGAIAENLGYAATVKISLVSKEVSDFICGTIRKLMSDFRPYFSQISARNTKS